jgi:signal transduction histidine kinase
VLSHIAEIGAKLINAKFGALGVPDGKGGLSKFLTYGVTPEEISRMDHYPLGRGLLGLLVNHPESLRLERMEEDERSAGLPPNHPQMTSFLGVPITSKGKILGSLYFSDKLDGSPFTEDDEQMVQLLAGNAAIAIENAMLYGQLRKLAVIEERDRISMELHDGIIQQIYAIGIKLDLVRLSMSEDNDTRHYLTAATQDLNKVIEDLRAYIQDLRVGVDYSVTLHEQFEEIISGFRQTCPARIVVDMARGFAQLTDARMHTILQITREALSNVARHSKATEVYVDLHETPTQIVLVISDNGIGFDPAAGGRGHGLHNLRQRARLLGGRVDIVSQPGRGATVTVILPL